MLYQSTGYFNPVLLPGSRPEPFRHGYRIRSLRDTTCACSPSNASPPRKPSSARSSGSRRSPPPRGRAARSGTSTPAIRKPPGPAAATRTAAASRPRGHSGCHHGYVLDLLREGHPARGRRCPVEAVAHAGHRQARDLCKSFGYRQFAIPALHGLLVGNVTQDCLHAKTFVTRPLSRRWNAVLDAWLRLEQRSSYAWTCAMEKAALGRSRHSPKNSRSSASCARSMCAAGIGSASCGPRRGDRRGRSRRPQAGFSPAWGRDSRPDFLAKLGRN
jgi:hypothetical protein